MSHTVRHAPGRRARTGRRRRGASAFQTIEEAFHLLRGLSLAQWVIYYLGAVPFVLAIFYFWADMSRSSLALEDVVFAAVGVTVVYAWMKLCQTWFCRLLWVRIGSGEHLVSLRMMEGLRAFAAQLLLQATALPMLLVSFFFLVPFGWTYAFYQNLTCLCFTRDLSAAPLRRLLSESGRLSHYEWVKNHTTGLIVIAFGLLVWCNLFAAAGLVPQLVKMLFGIDSVFTIFPLASLFNTSFLFATVLLTWLVMGPLLKAIYVLRCFYGCSRESGDDLLSRLAALQDGDQAHAKANLPEAGVTSVARVALIAGLSWFVCGAEAGFAQLDEAGVESPVAEVAPTGGVEALPNATELEAFESSIKETLKGKSYQWRRAREAIDEGEGEGGFSESLRGYMDRLKDLLEAFFDKLFNQGNEGAEDDGIGSGMGGAFGGLSTVLTVVLLTLVAVIIVWLLVQVVRRGGRKEEAGLEDAAPPPIDLEQEDLLASQLPEAEWMRLARAQLADGNHRLAMRAFFLASLAHLGERELIRVARSKSNRDYRRELELKGRTLPELRSAFDENVGLFERVWYGLHELGDESVERFMDNYERITAPADGI